MAKLTRWLGGICLVGAGVYGAAMGWQAWKQRPVWAELQVAPSAASEQQFELGAVRVQWDGRQLQLVDRHDDKRVLWQTHGGFLAAGKGVEQVEEFRGAMFVEEQRELLCRDQQLSAIEQQGDGIQLRGTLTCSDGTASTYRITLTDDGERGVRVDISQDNPQLNRLYLSWQRDADERFFGFGEQFSLFNLAGKRLPILVQEQGVGRGLQPITLAANLTNRAGGDWWTTYAAVPQYLTSKGRSFFSESGAYQVFDLRDCERVQLEVHTGQLTARIYTAHDAKGQIAQHTAVVGRMQPLPQWTQHGAIVGLPSAVARCRSAL